MTRAIENLIAGYAELVDDGDFARVGALLADATFTGSGTTISGAIAIGDTATTAASRSYLTVLQAPPGLPLQPIASGRYHDRFAYRDGRWHFTQRQVHLDLLGDVSRHLRPREH
ncbi:hypothetical protein ABIA39_007898 [Nocardia sp. GAS34]|uniref:nuclear transport factor 2 family protein n=1 Tax=unclassified Nocardia TaxID=2637762 RepID=UPI003D1A514D